MRCAKCTTEWQAGPSLTAGDKIECPHCGDRHTIMRGLDADGMPSNVLQFYKCGEKTYFPRSSTEAGDALSVTRKVLDRRNALTVVAELKKYRGHKEAGVSDGQD